MKGHKPRLYNKTEYRNFVDNMSLQFRLQRKAETIKGKVSVLLIFTLGYRRGQKADVDAYNKQLLDALEHAGVYENDSQVVLQTTLKGEIDKDAEADLFYVVVTEVIDEVSIGGVSTDHGGHYVLQ